MTNPEKPTEHLDIPATPPAAETAVDLAAQIERAISAFVRGGSTTQELAVLDDVYARSPDARAQVEATAARLFRERAVFDNLHFHSSLLTSGSRFFGDVLRRMGDMVDQDPALAESAALPVLIRLTEHYRRKGDHERMDAYAARVEGQLRARVEANEPLALAQLAKVRYEQSMGLYNQKNFQQAIVVGDESARLSERADDLFGALAARGNVYGLYRYEWARTLDSADPDRTRLLAEGRPALGTDIAIAQREIKTREQGSLDQKRFVRVEMNDAAHLMHVADLQGDPQLAAQMMPILERNTVFQEAFDPRYPGDYDHAQEWVRVYPQILARLQRGGEVR